LKSPQSLTRGYREGIERHIRVGGGIGRNQAQTLLDHIDILKAFLEEVLTNGQEWDDEQWTLFTDQVLLVLDEHPVRTRAA